MGDKIIIFFKEFIKMKDIELINKSVSNFFSFYLEISSKLQ